MRYKHILTVFFASLPVLVFVRALQLIKLTDHTTGLFTKDKPALVATAAIGFVVLVVTGCCLSVRRAPLKCPKVRKPLGIASLLMSIAIWLDVFAVFKSSYIASWQKYIVVVVGLLTIAFFALYALKAVKKYRLERLIFIVPTIYFAVRLIVSFISIAPIALISENAYMVLAQCSTALFMFEFAKIANGYDKAKSYKKILVVGALAVMFNAVFSVPQIVLLLTDFNSSEHQPTMALISSLLVAVFITMYLLAHFSNKNLKDHRYRHKKEAMEAKYLQVEAPSQKYYYGE